MAELDLEFLGRQLAALIEGQREIIALLADIERMHVAVERVSPRIAAREPVEQLLRAYKDGADPAEARVEILRELLAARIQAAKRSRATLGGR